jgi:hypothetical protein
MVCAKTAQRATAAAIWMIHVLPVVRERVPWQEVYVNSVGMEKFLGVVVHVVTVTLDLLLTRKTLRVQNVLQEIVL